MFFETLDQAYRMLRKAIKHNCPRLKEVCEGVIAAMEWDEYMLEVAM